MSGLKGRLKAAQRALDKQIGRAGGRKIETVAAIDQRIDELSTELPTLVKAWQVLKTHCQAAIERGERPPGRYFPGWPLELRFAAWVLWDEGAAESPAAEVGEEFLRLILAHSGRLREMRPEVWKGAIFEAWPVLLRWSDCKGPEAHEDLALVERIEKADSSSLPSEFATAWAEFKQASREAEGLGRGMLPDDYFAGSPYRTLAWHLSNGHQTGRLYEATKRLKAIWADWHFELVAKKRGWG